MADQNVNNTIKTTVELDVNQAQQSIVKLNSLASDGTQDLEKRLDAKNKQIEIQNNLNKKNIKDLESQVKKLKGVEGAEKELMKAQDKLNKAKLNEVKVNTKNSKSQAKLTESYGKSKGAVNKLDSATGGFITKLKLLAANPVILTITLLTAGLLLLKEAFTSSEEGQNRFAKATAVVQALLGNLLDIVADVAEFLVDAFTNPVQAVKDFADVIKTNITNRFEGLMELIPQLGKAVSALFKGNFGEAGQIAADAVGKVALGVDGLTEKVKEASKASKEFFEDQVREAKLAAQVADMRAKADKIERKLLVDRSVLESKIAQLRLDAKKEDDFSDKQRRDFLIEAARLQDTLIDKETEYLILRRDAQVLENTFSRSNKENLDAEAQAIAAVNDQIGNRAVKAKKLQTEINSINNMIRADDAKLVKEQEKTEADRLKKIATDKVTEQELKAENIVRDQEAQLELDEINLQRKRDLGEATLVDELAFLEKKRLQDLTAEDLRQSEIDVINQRYKTASNKITKSLEASTEKSEEAKTRAKIDGTAEAFGITKEVALVESGIALSKSIGDAWAANAKLGFPQNVIATGAQIAGQVPPIIKGIADIKSARFSGSKGGGGGGGSTPSIGGASTAIPTATSSSVDDLTSRNEARTGVDTTLGSEASRTASANVNGNSSGSVVFSEYEYGQFTEQVTFKENKATI